GAGLPEADFDAAAAAGIRRPGHTRAGSGGLRAQRRLRGAGCRRDRRSHGGSRPGAGVPRKVRGRRARRDAAQLLRFFGAGKELLMTYSIVLYGEPVLEKPAELVKDFNTPELNRLLDDMFESMYAARGVGLAAPQIGISKRIAVIDLSVG